MNSFASLLPFRIGESPGVIQSIARSQFPDVVRRSKFALHRPETQFPQSGKFLILGIATYSSTEMKLLDDIEAALGNGNGKLPAVAVFDVLDCSEMSDFEKFIPGLIAVQQTPVLGVVVDGRIVESATGLANVEKILREFNMLGSSERSVPGAVG